jgi:hypothetical protein
MNQEIMARHLGETLFLVLTYRGFILVFLLFGIANADYAKTAPYLIHNENKP